MDFLFELFLELIMEPIIECYIFLMMRFSGKNTKLDKDKIQYIVIIECIVLFIAFVVGGVMLLETDGDSLWGKAFMISSIGVSVSQILTGYILKKVKN